MRNAVDYPLRQAVHWQRPGLSFPNQPKETLFAGLSEPDRAAAGLQAARLQQRYHLEGLYASSSLDNYRENLFYLELLERALNEAKFELSPAVQAADIGPSHWFYVQALYALLRWHGCPSGRPVELAGYEADPYRVYSDLRSRWDHAQAHLQGLQGARYIPQGFQEQRGRFDLITMLFPFVFLRDHLEWGLPATLFEPEELLRQAWSSLKPGGLLLIVNQGEAEHLAQAERLAKAGIPPLAAFRHTSLFYYYDYPRYVLAARLAA